MMILVPRLPKIAPPLHAELPLKCVAPNHIPGPWLFTMATAPPSYAAELLMKVLFQIITAKIASRCMTAPCLPVFPEAVNSLNKTVLTLSKVRAPKPTTGSAEVF